MSIIKKNCFIFLAIMVVLLVGIVVNYSDSALAQVNKIATKDAPLLNSHSKTDNTVIVINQKIRSLLEDFSRQHGMTLNISGKVNMLVKNQRLPAEKNQFLNELAKKYSLDWYQRGNELFVSAKTERVTRIIATKNIALSALQKDLRQLAQNTEDFPFKKADNSNLVLISGPPSYLALVELVLEAITTSKNTNADTINLIGYGNKTSVDILRF